MPTKLPSGWTVCNMPDLISTFDMMTWCEERIGPAGCNWDIYYAKRLGVMFRYEADATFFMLHWGDRIWHG